MDETNVDALKFPHILEGVLYQIEPLAVFSLLDQSFKQKKTPIFVAKDETALEEFQAFFPFYLKDSPYKTLDVCLFPEWDTLPYDRSSPSCSVMSKRLETLVKLRDHPTTSRIILTTIAALGQYVLPPNLLSLTAQHLSKGQTLSQSQLISYFIANGYSRVEIVREPGEYAIRGGIIDLFPMDHDAPYRLDFWGDEIEDIRIFDPLSQLSQGHVDQITLLPGQEVSLTSSSIENFKDAYRRNFGANAIRDSLCQTISKGDPYPGYEQWMPFFYPNLTSLLSYIQEPLLILTGQFEQGVRTFLKHVSDHYQARTAAYQLATSSETEDFVYRPIPPETFYWSQENWDQLFIKYPTIQLSPFHRNETDFGGKLSSFVPSKKGIAVASEEIAAYLKANSKTRFILSSPSLSGIQHLKEALSHQGLRATEITSWQQSCNLGQGYIGLTCLDLPQGFSWTDFEWLTERDLFGGVLFKAPSKRTTYKSLALDLNAFEIGDLLVHQAHGIGQYQGLKTLLISDLNHDFLELKYEGGDKLFVPVENIEILSKYGHAEGQVALDKLGGVAWQKRKARTKDRIKEIADKLIKIAAERELKQSEIIHKITGSYDEFVGRFPYVETEDQQNAIEDVISDLARGRPMDRLICGDVGFGKTEVALRAAFLVASQGLQVAILTPTTLLSHQHYLNFIKRFEGFGIKVAELSRMVPAAQSFQIRKELAQGQVHILIATHALLSPSIQFQNLGLVIVDEEQHFGVEQKEYLKALKENVHLLTLTATPIPRTLQMAVAGIRDLSLIATPPMDRMSIRTFVLPFDPLVIREAILREKHRQGQVYYVAPKVKDLATLHEKLIGIIPEAQIAVAHGQLAPKALEDIMDRFANGKLDVLLSTNIVESGLDIPTANTLIIHRSDQFGLAQLYQLRGRVGRAKERGYAYFTLPLDQGLSSKAQRRLEVMQSLDRLGAGFAIASHDMDIRGAGNLLGDQQSGHIREVGVELYENLLAEAIQNQKQEASLGEVHKAGDWSPEINITLPILIPESYVSDLNLRMNLYRRLGSLKTPEDIDLFQAELKDRFGTIPLETQNLLKIIHLKNLAKSVHVEKIDVGPKGVVIGFKDNTFPNPGALLHLINVSAGTLRPRPDQRLVLLRAWQDTDQQLEGIQDFLKQLQKLGEQ